MLCKLITKHSRPSCSIVVGFVLMILIAGAVLPEKVGGQKPGGPYADVKAWAVTYLVYIQTPEGCCDIESTETTEGVPNQKIHYSIDREFWGAYILGGPEPGYGAPQLETREGADTRRNPALRDQIDKEMLSKYVGWHYPSNQVITRALIHAKINDYYYLDSKSQDCASGKFHYLKESTFDHSLSSDAGHALLGFDLASGDYNLDLSIAPVNFEPTPDSLVITKTASQATSSDASDDSPLDKHETKSPLTSFLNFRSKSVQGQNLKYVGFLQGGDEAMSICTTEKPTDISVGNDEMGVAQDIKDKKTVTIKIEFHIRKGINLPSFDRACK